MRFCPSHMSLIRHVARLRECASIFMCLLQYVLGKGGVALMLIIIFMAVTSAGSAEFMAVGSLFTFDIYKVRLWPTYCYSTLMQRLMAVDSVLPFNICAKRHRLTQDQPKP